MVTREDIKALAPYRKYPCRQMSDGSPRRFSIEVAKDGIVLETVFVYKKGSRTRGWRYPIGMFLDNYSVEEKDIREKDPTPAWHKRLKRAVKCMGSSGLWPEVRTVYENILESGMTWQERDTLRMLERDDPEFDAYFERFPFAFRKDKEEKLFVDSTYVYELSECRLKAVYFGKWMNEEEKERIRDSIKKGTNYDSGRIRAGYDVSYSYDAGKKKAWYSEEYRNCGNGHYYLALDENTALFVEDD